MAFDQYEEKLIEGYGEEIQRGIILPYNSDLESTKAKSKYTRFCNDVIALKPKEYKTSEFKRMNRKDILTISLNIILMIFGEKVIPHIDEFFSHLHPNGSNIVLDGITITAVNRETNEELWFTEVPDIETMSNITTIVHEFTHFFLRKLKIDFNKKRQYEEIISIYAEKIANIIIENELHEKNYRIKLEEHRLESIAYQYGTQLIEARAFVSEYEKLKKAAEKDFFAGLALMNAHRDIPILKTEQGRKTLEGYYQSLADSYGIGYLYSEALLTKHLDDPVKIKSLMSKIITQEETIQSVLDYYGINAKNYEIYNAVQERINAVKLFKK